MPVLFRGDVKICEVEVKEYVPARVEPLGSNASVQSGLERYILSPPRAFNWPADTEERGYRLEFEDGRSVNLRSVKSVGSRGRIQADVEP
jgi:hypothetical protein